MENLFDELKRYVCFGPADEAALRAFAPHAEPHFEGIANAFYDRIHNSSQASKIISGPEQTARLRRTLCAWLASLVHGPWDESYYAQRQRIGRMHVAVGLPQRYVFGTMNLVRVELQRLAAAMPGGPNPDLGPALDKLLDLELAILLESYNKAQVEQVQQSERLERSSLLEELALSEARYDEIVERADALITTLDSKGRILLVNTKCEQLTGAERHRVKGASWVETFVREDDRDVVRSLQERAHSDRTAQAYEGPLVTERGEHLVRWHFTRLPQGTALCAIGIDVTHEHELAVRARRAERLASLGTMAAGFAHEIRNPLNSAKLQLSVARRRLNAVTAFPADAKRAVGLAEVEMQRVATLVEDFLVFARPQPLQLAEVELRTLVGDVITTLEQDASAANVALQLLPGDSVRIELDAARIQQVVMNLLKNAIEASQPGGHVQVSIKRERGVVRLIVEDEGAGFASDAPIFEPFFTTKDNGTGLGLAIVHRIVMDHAGHIETASEPGHTVFAVTLPIARQRSGSRVKAQPPEPQAQHKP